MTVYERPKNAVSVPTDFGAVDLSPDPDRPGTWVLLFDYFPQSYVNLADPRNLRFKYIQWLASVADCVAEPGAPIRALHLGGGGLTLPRYVAATRPGSAQLVVDRDAALMETVRKVLPLPDDSAIEIRIADARDAMGSARPRAYDLIVTDVLIQTGVPARLTSLEFATSAAQALTEGGQYALNIVDSVPFDFARRQVATLRAAFGEVCLFCEPDVLRGDRIGNLLLVGGNGGRPARTESMERAPAPVTLLGGGELDRFAGDARPLTDADAVDSPPARPL
ncbi:spermidine synthase [Nonomuraea rhizosphaerae]|uniref:spermidine synthase n=1 Tax=Nonomuraea rhizosphaerae TaxID=2665663 RepID=UPI001C5D5871|nr:fused MFS/spermidine synthase [Nonomuraea rhizosphaerae]